MTWNNSDVFLIMTVLGYLPHPQMTKIKPGNILPITWNRYCTRIRVLKRRNSSPINIIHRHIERFFTISPKTYPRL